MKKTSIFALAVLAACSLMACNDSAVSGCQNDDCTVTLPGPSDVSGFEFDFSSHKLALAKADSCDDYRAHLLDELAVRVADSRFSSYHYCGWLRLDDVLEEGMQPGAPSDSDQKNDGAGEYTTTNVQEAGVDELDTVKNDDKYMYTVRGGEIHIAQIWPPEEMKEIKTIERDKLQNDENTSSWFSPQGIFLTSDKKLIDIGQANTWRFNGDRYWYGEYSGTVSIRVFDVKNPSSPALLSSHQIDGKFVDARLVGDRLHFVTSAVPIINSWYEAYKIATEDIPGVPKFYNPCDEYPNFDNKDWSDAQWEEWQKKQEEWRAKADENKKKYLPVIRAWLEKKYPNIDGFKWPKHFDGKTAKNAIDCTDVYIPSSSSHKDGFLLVSELYGDNYKNFKSSAIADDGWMVYASQKNLYVSTSSYNWSWWSCGNDVDIDGGKPGSDEVKNSDSCKNYTHIHHFNLGEKEGGAKYINSGEIDGIAESSFNFSEHNDHLRVVTSPVWGNSPTGHKLSVLDINSPKEMKLAGAFEGFGKDERLYASRMIGDKGYFVTFKNTDPLFVFDLSDPAKPKQVGELKINGYSSYIHPVGSDHLLTIGQDADDDGRILGMQLELFDVSNPAKPTLKYKTKIHEDKSDANGSSYGWSEALSNHHAFQYHAGSGLLAIPVNINSWKYTHNEYDWNYDHFSGIFVYRVTPSSDFEFVGGVDHADLVSKQDDNQYNYNWWVNVSRSRFYFKTAGKYDSDAYIYSISDHGLKVSDANKPDTTVQTVKYKAPENSEGYHPYY